MTPADLGPAIDEAVRDAAFSGIVRVDRGDDPVFERAYGFADRAHGIANAPDTLFATASGCKGFTALVVLSLIDEGVLALDTTARSILGDDLPLIADDVTVEHLLAHRSGIGDYLDEDELDDRVGYTMPVPVQRLDATEDYLTVLDGFPTVFPAGERFAYNNGGFVVLALIAERASGTGFHDLVAARVTGPAGMADTAYLRSDELPGRAALGYLWADRPRTNVFHLPVRGTGDGGAYTSAADMTAFWRALIAGRIVPRRLVEEAFSPRSEIPEQEKRYGLGFHLHETSDVVWLVGHDAGVSFCSTYDPTTATTGTVICNWTEGAWPIVDRLDELVFD
jgi:CubicO group peptidase (beta-lactamase class C family)